MEIKVISGRDKNRNNEKVREVNFYSGHVYTIVGKTGSGKSQLIEDIESLVQGDSITKRFIEVSNDIVSTKITELSQNMNFLIDLTVEEFINTRNSLLDLNQDVDIFLNTVNSLCGEKVSRSDKLTRLSGGQSRAVMITDVVLNNDSKIVLIDEIENAGIDKVKAINLLIDSDKIVIIVTHDPLLGLFGENRIVMKDGGIDKVIIRSKFEESYINKLYESHKKNERLRNLLRNGEVIVEEVNV